MSGKFTNLMYDQDAYNEQILRSTDPLLYKVDPNYAVNCGKCFAPYGPRGGHPASVAVGDQIDVDSVLKGRSKIYTKSNKQQIPDSLAEFEQITPRDCPDSIQTQYSRYINPPYEIKGLTTRDLHFDYPLFDPQCQIFENFAINTKLQAKDEHRAVWQIPFNQRDLWPTERLGQPKNCMINLNCNYAPYTS